MFRSQWELSGAAVDSVSRLSICGKDCGNPEIPISYNLNDLERRPKLIVRHLL